MRRRLVLVLHLLVAPVAMASQACSEAYDDAAAVASLKACAEQAEAGDAESQLGYALVLWSGHGRGASYKESIAWLRRAAQQGNTVARAALGRFLTDPQAPAQVRNLSEGYAWWVAGGSVESAAELKPRMSAAELAFGEQLAKEFRANFGPAR